MHLFCYWLWNISLTSMSGVLSSVSSRHHSVLSGVRCTAGLVSFRLQVSWGTTVHSCLGSRLGTSLVTRWHVFWGFRSHDSSGTSTRESICQQEADSIIIATHVTRATCLSWHSSSPSVTTQPRPQISTGSFAHAVSPTNLPARLPGLSRY